MQRRSWKTYEDEYIRRYYGSDDEPVTVIASNLERPINQVYARARKLGLSQTLVCVSDEQIGECLRECHPLGWTDSEVKAEIERRHGIAVDRHRVGIIRRRLGLGSNALSGHRCGQVRQRTADQLQRAGLTSMAQLRVHRWNAEKEKLGWPQELTIRAVQAAELFWRRGPMTRMQLCHAMGYSEKRARVRTEPKSNAKGGTVLAELMRAGLLMRLKKSVPSGQGRGGRKRYVDLYLLNPGVQPNGRQQKHAEAI